MRLLENLSGLQRLPQASGMPTNSQNKAALRSSPPLPMPNEPCWIVVWSFVLAACCFATSASHLDRQARRWT
jgi:hypothetical protein